MALLMRMADEVANSQFSSFTFAIAVISVIMIATLGSLQGGLMAMIPNMIPALLGFGLMGLGIALDTDTPLIAPLIIGIAVDDTIHFMTHYRVELIGPAASVKAWYRLFALGQAVMFTTMVLGLGFALLSFSDYLAWPKLFRLGSNSCCPAMDCFDTGHDYHLQTDLWRERRGHPNSFQGENCMTSQRLLWIILVWNVFGRWRLPKIFQDWKSWNGWRIVSERLRLSVQPHAAVHLSVRH